MDQADGARAVPRGQEGAGGESQDPARDPVLPWQPDLACSRRGWTTELTDPGRSLLRSREAALARSFLRSGRLGHECLRDGDRLARARGGGAARNQHALARSGAALTRVHSDQEPAGGTARSPDAARHARADQVAPGSVVSLRGLSNPPTDRPGTPRPAARASSGSGPAGRTRAARSRYG